MRRLALTLLLAAGLLAACGGPTQLAPYPEDCVTAGAPCPGGEE